MNNTVRAARSSGGRRVKITDALSGEETMTTYIPATYVSAASTNATNLKASAGKIGMLTVGNVNAAARYLAIYDKATTPVPGTDVPVLKFIIPGNTAGAGTNIPIPDGGLNFNNGISWSLGTGAALLDNNAVAASEITVNFGYI